MVIVFPAFVVWLIQWSVTLLSILQYFSHITARAHVIRIHLYYARALKGLGWLVVLRFNATLTAKVISWHWEVRKTWCLTMKFIKMAAVHSLIFVDAYVFPGFLTPAPTQISFQSHRLLFSHASAEIRGENTPERNFVSTGSRTHNHQVSSPTRSPPCGAEVSRTLPQKKFQWVKRGTNPGLVVLTRSF